MHTCVDNSKHTAVAKTRKREGEERKKGSKTTKQACNNAKSHGNYFLSDHKIHLQDILYHPEIIIIMLKKCFSLTRVKLAALYTHNKNHINIHLNKGNLKHCSLPLSSIKQ